MNIKNFNNEDVIYIYMYVCITSSLLKFFAIISPEIFVYFKVRALLLMIRLADTKPDKTYMILHVE